MRVVYVKPIQERIRQEISDATRAGKSIEKFVLTRREMDHLLEYCRMGYDMQISGVATFCGHRLEVEG